MPVPRLKKPYTQKTTDILDEMDSLVTNFRETLDRLRVEFEKEEQEELEKAKNAKRTSPRRQS